MFFSKLFSLSSVAGLVGMTLGQAFQVPVPWQISDISIGNVRHGSGGFWSFKIIDSPTLAPQGFNTTCSYNNPTTYSFALDGAPYNAPCADPSVTFGLYPAGDFFIFNITHTYATSGNSSCGAIPRTDNGTWSFSKDDVRGQQDDVGNNFGQSGSFYRSYIAMYPDRAIPSETCEFCVKKRQHAKSFK